LADLELVSALQSKWNWGAAGETATVDDYAQAFRAFGLDLDVLPPEEAGSRIRERSVAVELAEALDGWVALTDPGPQSQAFVSGVVAEGALAVDLMSGRAPRQASVRPKQLLVIAQVADPDPLRYRLRQIVLEGSDLKSLRTLLAETQVEELPLLTVVT